MQRSDPDWLMCFLSSGTKKVLRLIQYVPGAGGAGFGTSLIFGRRISSTDELEMSEHRTDIETYHTLSAKSNSRHQILALENHSLASLVEFTGVKGTTFSRRLYADRLCSTRTAVPSSGAWRQGDLILNSLKGSAKVGWHCTTSGTFGGLTFLNCVTDSGSNVIRGFAPTGLNVGDYVYVNSAFADTATAKQILIIDTTNSRIVVDDVANANSSGVTVTTTNPIFTTINGFETGDGGTVTQATSKSTAVTLSKVSGQITMHNSALASGAVVSFTWTNTAIEAADGLILHNQSGGTPGAYMFDYQCAAGSAVITVRNLTGGSLSEAIVIGFQLIKGVIA